MSQFCCKFDFLGGEKWVFNVPGRASLWPPAPKCHIQ